MGSSQATAPGGLVLCAISGRYPESMAVTNINWPWLYEPTPARHEGTIAAGQAIPAVWTNTETGVQIFVNARATDAGTGQVEVLVSIPQNNQLVDITAAVARDLLNVRLSASDKATSAALAADVVRRIEKMIGIAH